MSLLDTRGRSIRRAENARARRARRRRSALVAGRRAGAFDRRGEPSRTRSAGSEFRTRRARAQKFTVLQDSERCADGGPVHELDPDLRAHDVNALDYLTELLRHAVDLKQDPSAWMPWNYREALARLVTPAAA
jgi:hypothetical protein